MGKRANREGTTFERADRTWEDRIWVEGLDGEMTRKSFTGPSQGSVIERRKAWLKAHPDGVPMGNNTVEQVLSRWLRSKELTVASSTLVTYQAAYKHIVPALGKIKADKLKPEDVERLMLRTSRSGLSTRTVKLLRDVLSQALKTEVRRGRLSRNVAEMTDPPRHKPSPKRAGGRALTGPELQMDLRTAEMGGRRLYAAWMVMFGLGLRRGEVLGLRWTDWNEGAGTLQVAQQVVATPGGPQITQLKTAGSKAVLRLPAAVADALAAHRAAYRLPPAAGPDANLIFTTSTGTRYHPRNINREMKRVAELAGLGHLGTHDARRTVATALSDLPPSEAA